MSVVVPLDSRQTRITRLLLADRKPATLDAIAAQLKLTTRVVRYNLPPVESYLRSAGLEVVRRPGVGIWVSGDDDKRKLTLTELDPEKAPRVLAAEDPSFRSDYGETPSFPAIAGLSSPALSSFEFP